MCYDWRRKKGCWRISLEAGSEIVEILRSKGAKSKDKDGNNIPHVLKLSIVFKNPNTNVKDIIIKFNYVINCIKELPEYENSISPGLMYA